MKLIVIFGTETYLIKEKIKEIISKHPGAEVTKTDLAKETISEMLIDASMPSMFNDAKILIGTNCYFLTGSKPRDAIEQDTSSLLKYLEDEHDALIILTINEETIDSRKKIVKELKKVATVIEFQKKDADPVGFVINTLKDAKIKINREMALYVVNRVGHNLNILKQELDKLILYLNGEVELTKDIINEVMVQTLEDTIWDLTDQLLMDNKKEVMEIYENLLTLKEDPIKIYNILASQYRLILEVSVLSEAGYTNRDIASKLKVHPYRVEIALKNSRRYDKDILNKYLNELFELDYNIKSGEKEAESALRLWLLKI